MSKFAMVSVAVLTLAAACCRGSPSEAVRSRAPAAATCKAAYVGELVVSADDDGRALTVVEPYGFGDEQCTLWMVPAGAHVDGASIPKLFWSVLGGPFEGKYRNASVIHDWFCDRRTIAWQRVHRMFYDAMLTSGVARREAKLMYLAVYYQGPRWTNQALLNNRLVNDLIVSTQIDPAMLRRYKEIAFARDSSISAGVRYIAERIDQNDIDLDKIEKLAEQARARDGISEKPL